MYLNKYDRPIEWYNRCDTSMNNSLQNWNTCGDKGYLHIRQYLKNEKNNEVLLGPKIYPVPNFSVVLQKKLYGIIL